MHEYQATIEQEETITAGYQQLITARESQTAITEQLTQMQELDKQYNRLEKDLSDKKSTLEKEKSGIEARIEGLEKQIADVNIDDLDEVRQEVDELEALDQQRDESTQAIQKMKEERSGLNATLDALRVEGTALNERLESLEAADGATCPLCGQPLTEDHRDDMLAQLTDERDTKREDYRRYNARISAIDVDSKEQQKQVDSWALQLKNLPALQQRFGALEDQIAKAQTAEDELHIERTKLEQVEERSILSHTVRNSARNCLRLMSNDSVSVTILIRMRTSKRSWKPTANLIVNTPNWNSHR